MSRAHASALRRLLTLVLLTLAHPVAVHLARATEAAPAPRSAAPPAVPLTVFAAASLTNVLQAVGAAYTRASGQAVTFSFAGTQVLARQLEAGARADLFISADEEWMDYAAARGLLEPATRSDLLGNRLVLIAPAGSKVHPDRVSHAFTEARVLAGIPDVGPDGKLAPTFHELRSLSKRLYDEQGNVDTRALLGHATARMGALYANPRGVEPIKVRVGRKA